MNQLKGCCCQPGNREEHLTSCVVLLPRGSEKMAETSRVNREVYARFCGRLEVKFLRPTRPGGEIPPGYSPGAHHIFEK